MTRHVPAVITVSVFAFLAGWGDFIFALTILNGTGIQPITLGIYSLVWQYKTFQEMKDHSHEGIGGPIGLVLGIFVGFVNVFLIPYEVGNIYAKSGEEKQIHPGADDNASSH